MKLQPHSNERASALRVLLDYVKRMRRDDSPPESDRERTTKKLTNDQLATAVGLLSTGPLTTFLTKSGSIRDEAEKYAIIGSNLPKLLSDAKLLPLPTFMSSLVETVFEDGGSLMSPPKESASNAEKHDRRIVKNDAAIATFTGYPDRDNDHTMRQKLLPKLTGLSVVVRLSNELKLTDEPGNPPLSIGLLNLVPEWKQVGAHHPLFKLYRKNRTKKYAPTVEGVVLAQSDKLVLTGRADNLGALYILSIAVGTETADIYRDENTPSRHRALSALLMGAGSGQGRPFAGLGLIYGIRGGQLAEGAAESDKNRFDAVLDDAHERIGVYPLNEAAKVLSKLGVQDTQDQLAHLLARSEEETLFTVE